ncbi:MAG TPA: GNAT family N-acetyltransferase [Herpetosiphonaceae bacterium]
MHLHALIARTNEHLIQSRLVRMAATEARLGPRFGFATMRRASTVAITARAWPASPAEVPFNRVFDYRALADGADDLLLAAAGDAVVEVLPGTHTAQTTAVLQAAGYAPAWRIPWLFRTLDAPLPVRGAVEIEQLDPTNLATFAATWLRGFGTTDDPDGMRRAVVETGFTAPGFACFLARVHGQPAAVGVVRVDGDHALVDGAATVPDSRGQGLQTALLATRLTYAWTQGARVAVSRTNGGSISEANMVKLGLRPFVTAEAWRLAASV